MQDNFKVVNIKNKGKGLIALKNFDTGDILFNLDFSNEKNTISGKDLEELSDKEKEHLTFVGNGKFVLDYSVTSFINHGCYSNLFIKYKNYAKCKIIAKKPIRENEELTLDYALDQGWQQGDFLCNCGSSKCRNKIFADFFKLPKKLQKENIKYAAPWIKRQYSLK